MLVPLEIGGGRAAPPRWTGDAGRYSRSFGLSASLASPPCGEWKAYRVTAAIARNSIESRLSPPMLAVHLTIYHACPKAGDANRHGWGRAATPKASTSLQERTRSLPKRSGLLHDRGGRYFSFFDWIWCCCCVVDCGCSTGNCWSIWRSLNSRCATSYSADRWFTTSYSFCAIMVRAARTLGSVVDCASARHCAAVSLNSSARSVIARFPGQYWWRLFRKPPPLSTPSEDQAGKSLPSPRWAQPNRCEISGRPPMW